MDFEKLNVSNTNEHAVRATHDTIEKLIASNPEATVQDLEAELGKLIQDPQTSSPMKVVYEHALAESQEYNKEKNKLLAGIAME
jgi:hypothetical protein